MAALVDQFNAWATKPLASRFFFLCLQWNSSKVFVTVCSLLAEVCTAFLLHAWNVLVTFAKPRSNWHAFVQEIVTSAYFSPSQELLLLPRSQCLCRRRSGKGKPKIFLPFDHSNAWDFSDEEIASLRRSPGTGSKYSVVDRHRTYTPTARRRAPVHCRQCSRSCLNTILSTQEQTWRKTMVSVSSYNMKRTSLSLQKSCKQRWRTSAVHISHTQTGAPGAPRRALLTADGFQNLTSMQKHWEKKSCWVPREKILIDDQGKEVIWLSFCSENGIDLCWPGCPAAVDLGCIHFPVRTTSETNIPLRRQSHKSFRFSVNSCSISTSKPSIESSRPQVYYSKTRSEQGQQ